MKGILCACLLLALQSLSAARAYETDIHYSTTYVLARAVGWSETDSLTIASANQAVDENQATVAALEVEATPSPRFAGYVMSSFRQADRNLRFHCFSKSREKGARISADVRKVISRHFAQVPDHREDRRGNAKRLIALGVALHCQQDAHSHLGFGGSCGSHSGNCHGHSYQTFLDQVVFGLLKKHYYNPDHPGVSGQRLFETLLETARELAAHRPKGASRPIPTKDLIALSDALRGSGLDLPDEVRRDCNRYIAGKWLSEYFRSSGLAQGNRGRLEKLPPAVARTCRNASLATVTIAQIPRPRFPRLNPDATPHLVRSDGTYQLVREGDFAGIAAPITNYKAHKVRVQLSHWSQVLALSQSSRKAR